MRVIWYASVITFLLSQPTLCTWSKVTPKKGSSRSQAAPASQKPVQKRRPTKQSTESTKKPREERADAKHATSERSSRKLGYEALRTGLPANHHPKPLPNTMSDLAGTTLAPSRTTQQHPPNISHRSHPNALSKSILDATAEAPIIEGVDQVEALNVDHPDTETTQEPLKMPSSDEDVTTSISVESGTHVGESDGPRMIQFGTFDATPLTKLTGDYRLKIVPNSESSVDMMTPLTTGETQNSPSFFTSVESRTTKFNVQDNDDEDNEDDDSVLSTLPVKERGESEVSSLTDTYGSANSARSEDLSSRFLSGMNLGTTEPANAIPPIIDLAQLVAQYVNSLVIIGPSWPKRELDESRWEPTFARYHELIEEERKNQIFLKHFNVPEDVMSGCTIASPYGDFNVIADLTNAIPRPYNVHAASRQYWVATLSAPTTAGRAAVAGKTFTVKTSDLNSDGPISTEYYMLKVLEGSGITPRPIYLTRSEHPNPFHIEAQMSVVETTRGPTLYEYMFTRPVYDPVLIMSLCREVLWLIAELHSYGIAHGSITGWTIVFNGPRLILTEFEFATMYTRRAQPLPASVQRLRDAVNPFDATPFELTRQEGTCRRDDLYRWVEIMARLLFGKQFDQVMQRNASARHGQDGLYAFKLKHKHFILNGLPGLEPWKTRCSPEQVKLIKAALGRILDYIRSLQVDDNPDYEGLDDELLIVLNALI